MKFAKLFGIDIKVNILLFFFIALFFFIGFLESILISFLVVLLHESAHTFMARWFGYKVNEIELFPFGGVARIEESIGVNPNHEIMIAIAGPLANFFLALIGYHFYFLTEFKYDGLLFFNYSNLAIGIFNLMPVIPLDGGRILRAYLAYFLGFKRATKITVMMAKITSLFIFGWGIYATQYEITNFFFSLIAVFLYVAAQKEHAMAAFVFMKEITQKKQFLLSEGVLRTRHLVAVKSTSVKEIMNQFVPRKYHIIMVMDVKCNVVGLLTESEVLEGMMKFGLNVSLERLLIEK